MPKKDFTLTSKVILGLHMVEDMMLPFVSMRDLRGQLLYPGNNDSFRAIFYRLEKRGLLKYIQYKKSRFIKLTEKGQLEALLMKSVIPQKNNWDGKWRVIIFDIPNDANNERDKLRRLLRKSGFKKLQGSVFISPNPLNREAIIYLKETKLIDYIRILKVEEMDEDKDLKKQFELI
jgi:CRISPR-associated endonuclease Cas2